MAEEHLMRVMDSSGDLRQTWNPDNKAEVEAVRKVFNDRKKMGYSAYAVKKDGTKGELITEFDPDAAKIILAPRISGG